MQLMETKTWQRCIGGCNSHRKMEKNKITKIFEEHLPSRIYNLAIGGTFLCLLMPVPSPDKCGGL